MRFAPGQVAESTGLERRFRRVRAFGGALLLLLLRLLRHADGGQAAPRNALDEVPRKVMRLGEQGQGFAARRLAGWQQLLQ
jgi:hypothetical protein